jgi:HlyD family secretion protein
MNKGRFRRLGTYGLAIAAVPAVLWAIFQGLTWGLKESRGGMDPRFEAVPVLRGNLPEQVIGTGVTKPLRLVVVQSEIPGVVARVHVDDGDRVKPGDVLIELDPDRLEHHVAELRAAVAEAQARARFEVVSKARVDLAQAEEAHQRVSRLAAENVASGERLETSLHALERARVALSDAQAEQAARKAAVARAQAALAMAEKNLEKSVIRASLDGVVVERSVEVGSAVTDLEHGGTVIAVLADDKSIHVLAEVDENDISKVREGQPADVRIDAFPDERFDGHVRKVSWSGSAKGTLASFEVEIEVAPDARFRVGMSSDVRLTVDEHRDVLIVPNNAILRTDGGSALRRLTNGHGEFEVVDVRALYSDGFRTALADEAVVEGDHVLVLRPEP